VSKGWSKGHPALALRPLKICFVAASRLNLSQSYAEIPMAVLDTNLKFCEIIAVVERACGNAKVTTLNYRPIDRGLETR
jgi:hypothetical protein